MRSGVFSSSAISLVSVLISFWAFSFSVSVTLRPAAIA